MNSPQKYKVLHRINKNFDDHATQISKGKSEFLYKDGLLDIYWPPGEFEYINLVLNDQLDNFYREIDEYFSQLCTSKFNKLIFKQSLELNQKMMRLPHNTENIKFEDKYNIFDSYQSILKLGDFNFSESQPKFLKIINNDLKFKNINDWLKNVIWYGHRSGKYLCKVETDKTRNKEKDITDKGQLYGPYIA
tara:strand:- start:16 stop:588 length:573 start_codon:yes stop_codon:yes gene_type:complete